MRVTVRVGALFAIVGGALLAIGHLVNLAGGDTGTTIGHTLVLSAHVLLVAAIIGLVVRAAGEVLFSLGGLLAAAGTAMISALVMVDILVAEELLSRAAFDASTAGAIAIVGPVVFVIGIVLLGLGAIQGSLPTGAGALLVAGAVLALVGIAFYAAFVLGAVATGAGFVWLGMDMLTPEAAAAPPGA